MHQHTFLRSLGQAATIWLFCVGAAVCYGILHDQITVRLCLEYFTVGHPPLIPTTNPTLLALGWGIIATWWVGAILGLPTILVMRVGKRPVWQVQQLFRPFLIYLGSVGLAAFIFGTIGYLLAWSGILRLPQKMAVKLPDSALDTFISAGWAHATSYAWGVLGALVLWRWIWRQRGGTAIAPSNTRRRAVLIGGLLLLPIVWGCYLYLEYSFYQSFNDLYFPVEAQR